MPNRKHKISVRDNTVRSPLDVLMQKASNLHHQGKLNEVIIICRQVLDRQQNHFDALTRMGVVFIQIGDYLNAIDTLTKAINTRPEIPDTYNNLAVALKRLERFDEALISYEKAISLQPNYPNLYLNMGMTLQALKRFDEALVCFEKAVILQPNYPDAYNNMGNTLQDLKRFDEAIVSYEKAISQSPHNPNSYNNLGLCLLPLKRFDEALRCFEKAISLQPSYPDAYNNRGMALHELKCFDKALISIKKAIEINPNYAEAYNNLGITLHALKRYDEAVESYEKAISLRPKHQDTYGNLAFVQRVSGNFKCAIDAYKACIALEMQSLKAKKNVVETIIGSENAGDILLKICQLLKAINAPFFLVDGALLGIYRNGGLLPYDKDIDLGMPWDIDRKWLINQVNASEEFEIYENEDLSPEKALWNIVILEKATGFSIDIFFFKPDRGDLISGFDFIPVPILFRFSKFDIGFINYRDQKLPAPNDPEKYFEELYGSEWRIPNPFFDSVISAYNLEPQSQPASIVIGYSRMYDQLALGNWKKTYGYCLQLLAFGEDEWLRNLANWLIEQLQKDKEWQPELLNKINFSRTLQ